MIPVYESFSPQKIQHVVARELKQRPLVNRGSWQSQATDLLVHEAANVVMQFDVSGVEDAWAAQCEGADIEWANEHFEERIGGLPLNPAPSYRRWPWHSKKYQDHHVKEEVFDHTYPERFWPKRAERYPGEADHRGIRFSYGDYRDVVQQLRREPFSRQAYLPIFFPEDTGSRFGQRVPCTLGYHFIRNGGGLDCNYFMRSCDLTRHFLNDVYMAGLLMINTRNRIANPADNGLPYVGTLTLFISNLHLFQADEHRFNG